jgi:hypothetical protein
MEKVEIRAVIKYLCKKGMSPKEIHEDFMDTLGKASPSYSTVKNGLLNLRGAGRALRIMSSLAAMLCTIWSCATEGETCEELYKLWFSSGNSD